MHSTPNYALLHICRTTHLHCLILGLHGCAAGRFDRHTSAAVSTRVFSDEGRLFKCLRQPAGIWPTWSLGPGLTHSNTAWPLAALSSHPSLTSRSGSRAALFPTSTMWTWGRGEPHSSLIELLMWSTADALDWAAVCMTRLRPRGGDLCSTVANSTPAERSWRWPPTSMPFVTLAVRACQGDPRLVGLVPAISAERRSSLAVNQRSSTPLIVAKSGVCVAAVSGVICVRTLWSAFRIWRL